MLSELRSAASNLRRRGPAQHRFEDITEEEFPPGERDSVETRDGTPPSAPAHGPEPVAEATPSDSAASARQTEADASGPIDEAPEVSLEPEEVEQTSDPLRIPAIEPPPVTLAERADDRGEAAESPAKARRGRPPGSKNKARTGQRIGSQTFPASLPQPPREIPLDDAEPSETFIGILVPHSADDEVNEGCLLAGALSVM